jgi:serine/threonine protein kinase
MRATLISLHGSQGTVRPELFTQNCSHRLRRAAQAIILALMALASGTKLGPYEIQLPLGAGGMGEVCRAKDTRLNRVVAI